MEENREDWVGESELVEEWVTVMLLEELDPAETKRLPVFCLDLRRLMLGVRSLALLLRRLLRFPRDQKDQKDRSLKQRVKR